MKRNLLLTPGVTIAGLTFTCIMIKILGYLLPLTNISIIGCDVLSLYPYFVALILLVSVAFYCLETSHERAA